MSSDLSELFETPGKDKEHGVAVTPGTQEGEPYFFNSTTLFVVEYWKFNRFWTPAGGEIPGSCPD